MKRALNDERWTVRTVAGDVPPTVAGVALPARVPGCVHLDLIRASIIEHADRGFAERDGAWIGGAGWAYACRFEHGGAEAGARVDLVAQGLDTVARVSLNGREVGCCANAHHPHRFDVTRAVRAGVNELEVIFTAPLDHVAAETRRLGARPVNGDWGAYSYARKAACNFGWDWGPRVPTCGITAPVLLHEWRTARIEAVRPIVRTATARRAILDVHVDIARQGAGGAVEAHVTLREPRGRTWRESIVIPAGATSGNITFAVDGPALWWPREHGSPHRHVLGVELRDVSGPLDRWRGRTGLRVVRLDTTPDADGSAFTIVVNETPIFCRGANWILDGLFPAERHAGVVRARVRRAADANMNMLRVWGGGTYEHDAFYDACDALGMLVWQDFMFACATYPEEDPYPALVEAEARHVVARLARHPSVVLFCGGNENVLAYETWGWKEEMPAGQTWGRRYYHELLPRVVEQLAPSAPYWPDSPTSGAEGRPPNDPDHGDRHTWDARLDGYRAQVPRFVSEFGHQSPPNLATIRTALGTLPARHDDEALTHRQRAWNGDKGQYDEPMADWFGRVPASLDAWHYLAQLLQARALRTGIEWWRAHRPRCMGALLWQLNDAWAGHSWSIVDVRGRRKLAWYAVRDAFAPRTATIQPIDGRLALCLVNDGAAPWSAPLIVRRLRFDGTVLAEMSAPPVTVPPRAALSPVRLDDSIVAGQEPERELIVARAGACAATWWFARDRGLSYPPPRWTVKVTEHADFTTVRIAAQTLLRDVALVLDDACPDAHVDRQLLTLLPGEEQRIEVRATGLSADLVAPCVRCVNPYGSGSV